MTILSGEWKGGGAYLRGGTYMYFEFHIQQGHLIEGGRLIEGRGRFIKGGRFIEGGCLFEEIRIKEAFSELCAPSNRRRPFSYHTKMTDFKYFHLLPVFS